MSRATRATTALEQAGIAFTVHNYAYDPQADSIGLHAAAALGEPPERVLKTLMLVIDGKPACAIVPSDRAVAMKRVAAALGGRSAQMMKPADAERATGYRIGGISPFGQMRAVPFVIEAQALAHAAVFINGGQRGLQLQISPHDAAALLRATIAPIVA